MPRGIHPVAFLTIGPFGHPFSTDTEDPKTGENCYARELGIPPRREVAKPILFPSKEHYPSMTSVATESLRDQLWNRRYDENIAPITELCDTLAEARPEQQVAYVDPVHDVDECKIISLFSNVGEMDPSGFITAGDDQAATRLLGIHWQIGLRPSYVMPWNVHPWFTPGQPNGRLTAPQIEQGLRPLVKFVNAVPRASALVAHGTEAHRLADQLLKAQGPMLYKRGFGIYKVRSLSGRSFAGSPERQEQWLLESAKAYAESMTRNGIMVKGR
jgi:hypothetical protein